jgi:hypothetical protein
MKEVARRRKQAAYGMFRQNQALRSGVAVAVTPSDDEAANKKRS